MARVLAFRVASALPLSPDPLWAVLGPRDRTWTAGPWRRRDWLAALHGLLGNAPARLQGQGRLDLLVVSSPVHLPAALRLLRPGRHAVVPGTLSALVGEPAARRRASWRPHTLLAVDGDTALGWWTVGRWSSEPRLILVDVPDGG